MFQSHLKTHEKELLTFFELLRPSLKPSSAISPMTPNTQSPKASPHNEEVHSLKKSEGTAFGLCSHLDPGHFRCIGSKHCLQVIKTSLVVTDSSHVVKLAIVTAEFFQEVVTMVSEKRGEFKVCIPTCSHSPKRKKVSTQH